MSLEAISRGLFVVRQLAVTADYDDQDEAGKILLELAERKEFSALARLGWLVLYACRSYSTSTTGRLANQNSLQKAYTFSKRVGN